MTRSEELLRRALKERAADVVERPRAEAEFAARLSRRGRRRRSFTGRGLAVAAAAAAVVLVVLVPSLLSSHDPSGPAGSGRPERALTPADVRSRIDLPFTPLAISVGQGAAWAVDGRGGLVRIDALTGAVTTVTGIPAGIGTQVPVAGFGAVWLADPGDDLVLRLDPRTGRVRQRTAVTQAGPVAVGLLGVWAQSGPRELGRIDPGTGRVQRTLPVPVAPQALLEDHGALWVTSGDRLVRVDPRTGAAHTLAIAGEIRSVAATAGALWVATDDALIRVSPAGAVSSTLSLHIDGDVAADHVGSTVYAATGGGALTALDERDSASLRSIRIADRPPVGPAVGLGSVWVARGAQLLRLVATNL